MILHNHVHELAELNEILIWKNGCRMTLKDGLSSQQVGTKHFSLVRLLEPGHGFKGKQVLVLRDCDKEKMYSAYSGKAAVRVWLKCENPKPQKRGRKVLSLGGKL